MCGERREQGRRGEWERKEREGSKSEEREERKREGVETPQRHNFDSLIVFASDPPQFECGFRFSCKVVAGTTK